MRVLKYRQLNTHKIFQCPDMEFKELEALLTDGRYSLMCVHLQNFCVRLQNIYVNGISAMMDCVTSTIDKLMIEPNETSPCVIARCSVLGNVCESFIYLSILVKQCSGETATQWCLYRHAILDKSSLNDARDFF